MSDRPAPGVVIHQPARGFRYGAEAFWLVGFALEAGEVATALDLGTGSGIAAMLLAARGVDAVGIDVRDEWAPLWRATLAESARPARLVRGDVRDGWGPVDLVVSNPPYFEAERGPVAPDPWKAAARTEGTATLAEFLAAAFAAIGGGGRVCFVLPIAREAEAVRLRAPTRWVRVGRRRVLLAWGAAPGDATPVAVSETDPRVTEWYARARGGPAGAG